MADRRGVKELLAQALLKAGHEERFRVEESEVRFAKEEPGKARRFRAVAYTGKDVGRWFGRMIVSSSGIKRDERMGMLLEHHDMAPVAVCDGHEVDDKGKVELEGYFLSSKASPHSEAVQARADEGWPWKMSIGIRFLKWHELDEGAEEEVNGRTFKGPGLVVDESTLFETSFIHVSPADWDTSAEVMRARAQESQMADKPENAAALAANLPAQPGAPALDRAALLAEGKRLAVEERNQLREAARAALPDAADKKLRLQVISGKLSLEDAKAKSVARLRKTVAEFEGKEQALKNLTAHGKHTGMGFDPQRAETFADGDAKFAGLPAEERLTIEVVERPHLARLWGDESKKAWLSYLKTKDKASTSGKRLFDDPTTRRAIERMAADIRQLDPERFAIAGSGQDLSRVTVNGFVGTFYNSYEESLSANWSAELAYQLQSDQEAELVQWLGPPPALQERKGPRIAKELPIYAQLLQAKSLESTVTVRKFDFDHQKFDLISRSFGLMGPIAGQDWDIRFSRLLENNPKAYDTFNLFSHTHTLGGDSGTMDNDLISSNGYPVLAVADPANPTQIEIAKILMALPSHMKTFAWANGIKMNAQMKRVKVMVHPVYEGIFGAAITSDRLDTGQSNPVKASGIKFELAPNANLTLQQFGYFFRADTENKPLLKTEPDPITMEWLGPGSDTAVLERRYLMGLDTVRSVGPGAWESAMRFTIGAA